MTSPAGARSPHDVYFNDSVTTATSQAQSPLTYTVALYDLYTSQQNDSNFTTQPGYVYQNCM